MRTIKILIEERVIKLRNEKTSCLYRLNWWGQTLIESIPAELVQIESKINRLTLLLERQ
jgi:hypothetical protein